jgi:hypothetical protein
LVKKDILSVLFPQKKMMLKITSVLVSSRRRIKAIQKDLVKVTLKFIRRGKRGKKREREVFPVPHAENGSKDSNGGPQLLVLYCGELGKIHMLKDNGSGWLKWHTKQGGITSPNHTQSHPLPMLTESQQVCFRTSLSHT